MINQELKEYSIKEKELYIFLQKKIFEKDKKFLTQENLNFLMNELKEKKESYWLEKSILLFFQNDIKYNFFDTNNEFIFKKHFLLQIIPTLPTYNFFNKNGDTFFIHVMKESSLEMKNMAITTMIEFDKNPQEILNIESKEQKTPLYVGIENHLEDETLLLMIINEAKIKKEELEEVQKNQRLSKNILNMIGNKNSILTKPIIPQRNIR
jgi:hypothetical protein